MKRITKLLPLLALLAILCFAWLTRVYRLGFPAEYVFDEIYHVPTIRLIATGDPRSFEWWHGPIYSNDHYDWLHPPLAKYFQAGSWLIFGQNATAWQLSSAIFGTLGILLTFIVAQLAFQSTTLSLLAAFLLALDCLWLVQSRVAMNDVFMTVWLLVTLVVYFYYHRRQKLTWLLLVGLFAGLGLATKWSAGLWLMGILIWESIEQLRNNRIRQLPWIIFCLLILPIFIYILSYLPMFLQGKNLHYFLVLHFQIWRYQILGTTVHLYQSTPWQWLLNLRPVWYWSGGVDQQIYALNNPLLAWFAVIALVLLLLGLIKAVKKQANYAIHFLLMLVGVLLVPWFFSPRIAFYYHYTPVVPIMAILLAFVLNTLYSGHSGRYSKIVFFLILTSLVWSFWLYYPHWIGLSVSKLFNQTVYWLLPSWR